MSKTLRASALLSFLIPLIAAAFASPADATKFAGCNVKPTSPLVVNVRDRGAKGDGRTNDTKAIQKAINEVAGTGGTVYVPPGTYMVQGVRRSLILKSKMTLRLADRATIKIIPNGAQRYYLLRIRKASDVAVIGGTLLGDRREHKGKKGEWGMGLQITQSNNIAINGVTSRDMWGDGFNIRAGVDVALCSVTAINNRRQGLSIIEGNRVLIVDSVFRDTRGTPPSSGIDMEPVKPTQSITNVLIEGSKFIDNAGDGILIAGKRGKIANVEIRNNLFDGNDQPILIENAPGVRSSAVCDNRVVSRQEQPGTGFNAYAESVQVVAPQMDCRAGPDMRFEKSRITKKKNKK